MEIDLGKDFYQLLNKKTHMRCQTGTTKWNQTMQLDGETWKKIFTSLKNICKETKLKEFQFKCIHRIVVTKKELYRYRIKTDDECLYCGEHNSFGIMSGPYDKILLKKFNYTTLFMDFTSTPVRCKTRLFTFLLSLITCYLNTEYNIFLNN